MVNWTFLSSLELLWITIDVARLGQIFKLITMLCPPLPVGCIHTLIHHIRSSNRHSSGSSDFQTSGRIPRTATIQQLQDALAAESTARETQERLGAKKKRWLHPHRMRPQWLCCGFLSHRDITQSSISNGIFHLWKPPQKSQWLLWVEPKKPKHFRASDQGSLK